MIFDISSLDEAIAFLQSPIGGVIFIPLYAIWVTFLLPGVWASMLAGALYGTWSGSFIVFVGACLGAEVSFFLGRTFCRQWVLDKISQVPKVKALEQGISREGLKLVLLTRLSPVFPFSLLNFIYGVTQVSFKDYSIGLIGILPGTILFCGLGAIAGDIARFGEVLSSQDKSLASLVIRIVSVSATIVTVFILTNSIKRSLKDVDDQLNQISED